MSTDGKYLKATDINDITIAWDITNGKQTQLPQDVEWKSGHVPKYMHDCTMDETNNHAAFNIHGSGLRVGKNYEPRSLAKMGTSAFPVEINNHNPAIIIFKRPTLQSYLYQQLFKRNTNDLEQLICLNKLLNNIQIIEDFPQKNLKQLISDRIQQLTQSQELKAKI
jgi:hypothetical protein